MVELLERPAQTTPNVKSEPIEFIDSVKSVHSDLHTGELVLPRAVSREKFDFIYDAHAEGAFDSLAPERREVVLAYFTSEHTTGSIPGYTKGAAQNHILKGIEQAWQNSSSVTRDRYPHSMATALKDKYDQRRGRPLSQAQKDAISIGLRAKSADEIKDKIKATLLLKVTPEMRWRSRNAALVYGIEKRKEVAKTDPEKAQKLERAALRRMRKMLLQTILNVRSQKFPDFVPPISQNEAPKKQAKKSEKPRKSVVLIENTKRSAPLKTEKITVAAKKPDLKVEKRLEYPREGAKRNLRFLREELPPEIAEGYIRNPQLKVEWKTLHAIINTYPYFRYENGALYYVIPHHEEWDETYIVTEDLLDAIWYGRNSHFQRDRDSINKFGRYSVEEIGIMLKNGLEDGAN